MKDVFISKSTMDDAIAFALVEFLEQNHISCYIAPRDIEPGRPYASALTGAINDCTMAILVASTNSNASEQVLNEIDIMSNKKKTILPLIIDDFELNDDLRYYIGRRQRVIAYSDNLEGHFPKVLDIVNERLSELRPKEVKPVAPVLPEPANTAADQNKNSNTIFTYNRERGIMINPEDNQRNVSFRTDTLINLLGGIYEKVAEMSDAQVAEDIFYTSGYTSGRNFGERLSSKWDTGASIEEMENKLKKWCQFDSAVGWGKFDITFGEFDEESGTISAKLSINEAFIVDKSKKRHICGFIRGYCTGVIETLLGSVDAELTCVECPLQNRFKTCCSFEVKMKG